MKKVTIAILLAAFAASVLPAPNFALAYEISAAKNYLLSHNSSPWSVMALTVLGEKPPAEHLKNLSAASAIEYTAPILAIVALGEDPRTFGGPDYVAALQSFRSGGQIGDPTTLNDDIFGILALRSAGVSGSDSILSQAKDFLLSRQRPDGGWGFTVSSASDTNMTATAILALLQTGISKDDPRIHAGVAYLQAAQNPDGGFPYDPQSAFGTASDSSSTAWVVWALNALGIAPAAWEKNGNNPLKYLSANQQSAGFFVYQLGSPEDSFSPITTAYAVIALSGKSLPFRIMESGTNTFPFRIEGAQNQVCAGETVGPTAMDIVKNASLVCGFAYEIQETSFGPYLKRINDDAAAGLTGWLYLVDLVSPSIGAADYALEPGDEVLWFYGEFGWPPSRLALSQTQINVGGSVEATVEYWGGSSWLPLSGANVAFGQATAATNTAGKAVLSPPEGIFAVSAERAGYIRSNQIILRVGSLSGSAVALRAEIVQPDVSGERIGFVVEPTTLDFGILKPGEDRSRHLTARNTGTVGLRLGAEVAGDNLYRDNLEIAGVNWEDFRVFLDEAQTAETNLRLSVPLNYAGVGVKNGEVIFWAVAR